MKFPEILAVINDGDTRRYELDISEQLFWFQGHFPGYPILPGVVQLRWAVELAQKNYDLRSVPREIMRLKFKSVIIPPAVVELTLTRLGPAEIQFGYADHEQEYSQGRLIFAETAQ